MSHELVDPVCAERLAFIENLREFASFLESHKDAPFPCYVTAQVSIADRESFLRGARGMGHTEKEFNGEWLSLTKKFGAIHYEIFTARKQFCERKVIGTRTVPERVEEIVEWSCSDSLFKPEAE